jgi:ribonuclease HI
MITLITDGACSGNPGPGGWAYRLRYKNTILDGCGFEHHTTNNRMELTAVLKGLEKLKTPSEVKIISDSTYVVYAFEKKWIEKWMDQYKKTSSFKKKTSIFGFKSMH